METQEYQNLVQTLMSNHLAASASEAQRMAKEMLGISEKVHNDSKKEQHYMIRGFKPDKDHVSQASGRPDVNMSTGLPNNPSSSQVAVEPKIQQEPLQPETKTSMPDPALSQGSAYINNNNNHMQNKINELKESAINPKPVNEQVDLQTPNMGDQQNNEFKEEQKVDFTQEPTNSFSSQNSELPGQSDNANSNSKQISPEEYGAKKFGNDSIENMQSDFLSLKSPQQSENSSISTGWPEQQPQKEPNQAPEQNITSTNNMPSSAPNQFIEPKPQTNENNSQNNNDEMVQNFQEEATQETTQEIKSEKKESRWTPEEEKLKKEVDLSRVFNFSNK